MAAAEQVLDLARKELRYQESPPNSNRTKYGKWFGLDGNPWCMMFIMWVFDQAGASGLLPVRTASCGEFMRAAKKARKWRTKDYKPGDIVIFDFPGNSAKTDHVGLVESTEEGALITIEGNTSAGNDANGGMVMRRKRKLSLVAGGFRPKYDKEKSGLLSIGAIVKFIGSKLYSGSGEEASEGPAAACLAKIDTVEEGAAHPYYLYGGGVEGWVDAADVEIQTEQENKEEPQPARVVEITARPSLKVRSGPGVQFSKKASLSTGTLVSLTEEKGGWGRLADGSGWISLQYTREKETRDV